jgi:hypothetical protein
MTTYTTLVVKHPHNPLMNLLNQQIITFMPNAHSQIWVAHWSTGLSYIGVPKKKETTKGIAIMTTYIFPTTFTSALAKLHWLKINAYMGCICMSMKHLPLSWKTKIDVFTNFTFRLLNLVSTTIRPYKRILLLWKPGQCLCNTRETPHKNISGNWQDHENYIVLSHWNTLVTQHLCDIFLDFHCNVILINHLI